MDNCRQINFSELFDATGKENSHSVFADEHFKREVYKIRPESEITLHIIADTLHISNVKCCHISIELPEEKTLGFVFDEASQIRQHQGLLISGKNKDVLYWLPKDPFLRNYDKQGRIEKQIKTEF